MSTLVRLQDILVKDYDIPRGDLTPDSLLASLGIDSLGMLELMFKIEDQFHVKIPDDPPATLATVKDVVTYIDGLIEYAAARQAKNRTGANT